MSRARRNPIGMPLEGVTIVRVGNGAHTHVYNPTKQVHLCESGKNAGVRGGSGAKPPLFESDANFVTCYRCQKLAAINLAAGRAAGQGPHD